MAIHFILGAAGSGKTHYCLEHLAQACEQDPVGRPIYFILPEQATFIHERLLCQMSTGGGFCRARIFSFSRLLYQARQFRGQPSPPALSEAGKLLVAGRIISQRAGELNVYARSCHTPGFASYVVKAAEEMSAYDVSSESLRRAIDTMEAQGSDEMTLRRLREIHLLLEGYLQEASAYSGYGQDMAYLAESIREGFMASCDVYIDGYADFTPGEMQVLTALLEDRSRTVHIALPVDGDLLDGRVVNNNVFNTPMKCYARIYEWAQRSGIPLMPTELLKPEDKRFIAGSQLAILEAALAGRNIVPGQATGETQVYLHQAADIYRELEAIGRRIIRLTREQGLHYRQIGIITRDTDDIARQVEQVFGELDIPYFIDAKKPLLTHPLIELCRATMECWAYHPTYERVMRYAKNILLPVEREDIDFLDQYSSAHGLRFWHWQQEMPWDFPPMPYEEENACLQAQEIREKACGGLLHLLRSLPKKLTARQWNEALLDLLIQIGAEGKLADIAAAAEETGRAEEASFHRQAWEKLTDFLAEADLLLGEEIFDAAELLQLYDAAFAGMTVSTIPPGRDQVFISSLERSRTPELAVAFVPRINDGVLPRRAVNDGLFTDSDRRNLRSLGCVLAEESTQRQFYEEYLAYIAMTRAKEGLYLSYCTADTQGRPLRPSPLLQRIMDIFPRLQENSYQQIDADLLVGGGTDLAALAVAMGREEKEELWQEVYTHYAADPQYAVITNELQDWQRKAISGNFASGERVPLDKKVLKSSVSRMERYQLCPFSWFAGYSLKLRSHREYRIDPASRGELYHQILADIGNKMRLEGGKWEELDEKSATLLVEETLNKYLPLFLAGILQSSARYAYLAGRIKDTLVGAVLLMADHARGGSFVPVCWEQPFGSGETDSLPAFSLELENGKRLELYGRIDRVDMAEDKQNNTAWFRIVDHKSGKLSLSPYDILAGLRLQLIVYLQVILDNSIAFSGLTARGAGVYYSRISDALEKGEDDDRIPDLRLEGLSLNDETAVSLADKDLERFSDLIPVKKVQNSLGGQKCLSEKELDLLKERVLEILRQTAGQMLDGMIQVSPLQDGNFDACAYCDYRSICGFDRELAAPRKKQIPKEWLHIAAEKEDEEEEA